MPSDRIQQMIEKYHYPVVNESTIDSFLANHEEVVLFFTENPLQFPESNDVAVILPELVKQFKDRFKAAVVSRSSEKKLQTRYRFSTWPALVFLKNSQYLGAITRVQNWDDYCHTIEVILNSQPLSVPAFSIPVVTEQTSGCQ